MMVHRAVLLLYMYEFIYLLARLPPQVPDLSSRMPPALEACGVLTAGLPWKFPKIVLHCAIKMFF